MKLSYLAAMACVAIPATMLGSTTLLTSDPGTGTTTTFTATGLSAYGNPGPVVVNGYTVTGNPQVDYGNVSYGLGANGSWNNFSFVATDETPDSILFNLGGAYGFTGAFVNYDPDSGSDATISVIGTDGVTVLGTYDLVTLDPISTPDGVNRGAFVGIQSSSDNIGYLELSNDYILAHSIEVGEPAATSAVTPEPSSMCLLATGVVGLAGTLRRKIRSSSPATM